MTLDAAVTATSRVRSERCSVTASTGSSTSGSVGTAQRTVTPARSAACTHGRTFASWSSRVTTISSPGFQVFERPSANR